MARVLVVEDNVDVADMVQTYLEAEGLEVLLASTAEAARQALASEPLEALVLDLRLPDGDGLALCRDLRLRSKLPILILSARNEDVDKIVGLEIGADDYLAKPFNPRELVARVKALLRRSAMRSPPEDSLIVRRGLSIDLFSHRVTYQGSEVELTPLEFSLLRTMALRPGESFSRQQLLEEVWGDASTHERTVDTHVAHLRNKLREVAPTHFIVSVRGVGYRFEV